MKVFDLHCSADHVFEGWFGSEADFRQQLERGLVECPLCGCRQLRKGLSAPRLNLGAKAPATPSASAHANGGAAAATATPDSQTEGGAAHGRNTQDAGKSAETQRQLQAMQAAWLTASRQIAAQTEDVGDGFADTARRMHHGDEPERPIRGQATPRQAMELLEEGVPVLPLALPKDATETLQ